MPHLSLALLGVFQTTLDGRPLTGFATSKVRALLAYLAVERARPHSREALAGLLWGDLPDRRALANLRYALSNLRETIHDREAIPPFLLISRDAIQFNPASDYELDVDAWQIADRAEGNADDGSRDGSDTSPAMTTLPAASLLSAAGRGRFLEGLACGSAPFEEWALIKREQVDQQILRVFRRLAELSETRGAYTQAQVYSRKQLEWEPWDEQAHRQLMRALACDGQRGAALAQYEACRRVLEQELAVEPSRATTALYESIRDGVFDPDAASHRRREDAARTRLPVPLTSFIGRQSEIAEVERLVKTTRLLTLTGAGGCGKTRLAIQVAASLVKAHDLSVTVRWIDLAALTDAGRVARTVAAVFGLGESPGALIVNELSNYLRVRAALLVLDNCEHLIDACACLTEALLGACSHLQVLATSRRPLGIPGEVVWRVPSLAQPDAIQLFAARATFALPNWDLVPNLQAATVICARLDGMPLAIELAAARLPLLSAEQIAARLGDRFELLTGGSRTVLPRHQTLRATMDWSYDLLAEEERILLRRLSVFAGGWSLEAAEAVASTAEMPPHLVLDLLGRLVDQSLVVIERKTNLPRYTLLETVRRYALEKLDSASDAEDARHRHLEFFVQLAEEAESHMRRAGQATWLDRLDLEHDNMRAALAWSLAPNPHRAASRRWGLDSGLTTAGLHLAGALGEFWYLRGYLAEGRQWFERLLAADPGTPAAVRAPAILWSGFLALRQGEASSANTNAEESLALYRELDDTPGIANSFLLLGIAAHFLGNDEIAAHRLQESLSSFQRADDRQGCAYARLWLARGQMRRGENALAAESLEASLAVFREMGDSDNESFALGSLGDLARRQGDYVRAAELRKASLRLAWQVGSRVETSYALEQLALIASAQKETERTVKLWGATEALRESTNRSVARTYEAEYLPAVAHARALMGDERFAAAWAEGRAMTIEKAVDYALED